MVGKSKNRDVLRRVPGGQLQQNRKSFVWATRVDKGTRGKREWKGGREHPGPGASRDPGCKGPVPCVPYLDRLWQKSCWTFVEARL